MKFIKLYNFEVLGKKLYKTFIIMLGLFIVSAVIGQLFTGYKIYYIINSIKELPSDLKYESVLDGKTHLECFTMIFVNNLKVSILATIIGLIPALYLSALVPIYNGYIIGVILAIMGIDKKNILLTILLGIIPHGVFEMFAILYASSIGIYITKNVYIFKRNNNEKDKSLKGDIPKVSGIDYDNISETVRTSESNTYKDDHNVYLKDVIPEIIKSYVLIIIPLLVIAALIESFITSELVALIK